MKIHGLLIAAGASRRLGEPKQLVMYHGQTLINHTIDIMNAVDLDGVTVVLGSNAQKIKSNLKANTSVLINENWNEGMGTTVSAGVSSLKLDADAVLIVLVDQYKLTSDLLIELIKEFKGSKNDLAVCRYGNDVHGPPAIFSRKYFNQLIDLKGDRGAGKLIKQALEVDSERTTVIDFNDGHLDVDRPQDLDKLNE